MKNENTKTIWNLGWVTAEKRMRQKLERCAREGWMLCGIRAAGYRLVLAKARPQALQYAFDWQPAPLPDEAEYLALYAAAGWQLCTKHDGFYVFCTPAGTVALHTDAQLLQQVRGGRLRRLSVASLVLLLVCLMLVWVLRTVVLPKGVWALLLFCGAACAAQLGIFATTALALALRKNTF